MFIEQYDKKFASIDPGFYRVPVMLQSGWRDAHQPLRHVVTRFGCHGFHFELCLNLSFHEALPTCVCKYCHLSCSQYHFMTCEFVPFTLTSVANFTIRFLVQYQ